jgi:hypothetical protein
MTGQMMIVKRAMKLFIEIKNVIKAPSYLLYREIQEIHENAD